MRQRSSLKLAGELQFYTFPEGGSGGPLDYIGKQNPNNNNK